MNEVHFLPCFYIEFFWNASHSALQFCWSPPKSCMRPSVCSVFAVQLTLTSLSGHFSSDEFSDQFMFSPWLLQNPGSSCVMMNYGSLNFSFFFTWYCVWKTEEVKTELKWNTRSFWKKYESNEERECFFRNSRDSVHDWQRLHTRMTHVTVF